MAKYKRYQKLQKYYLGVPVEPAEYKEGELIGIKDYNNIEECASGGSGGWITRYTPRLLDDTSEGFTENLYLTDEDGNYHFTIEGQGTKLKLFKNIITRIGYVDLTNMTSLDSTLQGANKVTTGGDLNLWDTSNITNMQFMFYDCTSLIELDLSNWNTNNLSNTRGMFHNCESLTTLNLSNWDMSNVVNTATMFNNCSSLTTLDLSSFDTRNVTDMSNMFSGCSSLTTLYLSSFNTSKVTEMIGMFSNCSSLRELDLSHFDTSKVTDMNNMFSGCNSLTTLNISGWDLTIVYNNGNYYGMFKNCTSLQTIYAYNCNETTINCINEHLSNLGLTEQVTIIK